ncbi:NAD(P)/FAD-dependent oxidoreductase [Catenulispora subtropica]|uniref:NAD(P)/FAD-dependent oxidoreductase n=2 Tax=Catenulispora subtropica TaxID=450798 RepID=A0ABP5C0H8_9ACTN
MAINLRRSGIRDFVVFDKESDIGGVWRDNVYPGCGCDVPSHLYSYSFARYADWTRAYPKQEEILDYLHRCVSRWKLESHLRLGTEIAEARWRPQEGLWRLRDTAGTEYTARTLVCGVGQLNRPRYAAVPGRETFTGAQFHSAAWDPAWPPEAFAGQDVAVIGTGASAVQFVPEIAPHARSLKVFQRSANWVIPKYDYAFGPASRWAFRNVPGLRLALRGIIYTVVGETLLYSAIAGSALGRGVQKFSARHLRKQIADPALRAKLTPDFPIGCKRILISDDWYPALARDNVDVVTDPVAEITPDGVRTADGTDHPATVVIHATGFRATEFLSPIEITGRTGTRLAERWKDGASAYLGIAVPEFPNLFLLYGPTTNLGHNSVVYMIESQVRYIMRWLEAAGSGQVEVAEEALAAYTANTQRLLSRTAWAAGCTSWYKTADGRLVNNWPRRSFRYRLATTRRRARDFLTP